MPYYTDPFPSFKNFFVNMLSKTKFGIKNQTKVFMTGYLFDLGAIEEEGWMDNFCIFVRKDDFFSRFKGVWIEGHFPLVCPIGLSRINMETRKVVKST